MLDILLALFCLIWVIVALNVVREIKSISIFESIIPTRTIVAPKLSIVIAACNEELTIKDAVNTISQQSYPDIEIIVVNDRSKDNTGKIIDELSTIDSRIKAVHVESLPSGWLGKVHALHKGVSIATGEWILFTDADVHFQVTALQRAVDYSIERNLDHLAIVPKILNPNKNFWLDVTLITSLTTFIQIVKPSSIENIGSSAYAGSGGFNLVRRSAFDKTLGFEWLKMEVIDDVGLGLMLKRQGCSTSLLISNRDISVVWYHTLNEMIKGLEKNSFLGSTQGKLSKLLALLFFLLLYISAPILAFLLGAGYAKITGVIALLFFAISAIYTANRLKLNVFHLMLRPIGLLILSVILCRSAFKNLKQGGIYWRGTFYSMKELLNGQRVKKF
ncbi:MAG: glycosyltransferase [Desulfamplus sp.]|nr:glycosyltransferase [Desulfamplus sp.]